MTTRHIYFLIFILTLTACSGNAGDEAATNRTDGYTPDLINRQDSLYHDVMEGHDAGMAKMGKLAGARRDIAHRIDSLSKSTRPADNEFVAELKNIDAALQSAQDGMNNWMENFKLDSAEDNETVRIAYLESERAKVNDVRDSILITLKKSDSVLSTSGYNP